MFKDHLIGKTATVRIRTIASAKDPFYDLKFAKAKILDIGTNHILLEDLSDGQICFHSGDISINVYLKD